MDFDTTVKLNIYETIARTTHAPTSSDVATALSTSPEEVEAAFERLHEKRLLVPEPGDVTHETHLLPDLPGATQTRRIGEAAQHEVVVEIVVTRIKTSIVSTRFLPIFFNKSQTFLLYSFMIRRPRYWRHGTCCLKK